MSRIKKQDLFQRLNVMAEYGFGVRIEKHSTGIFGFRVFDGELFEIGSVKYLRPKCSVDSYHESLQSH